MKRIGAMAVSLLLLFVIFTGSFSGFVISANASDAGITAFSVSVSAVEDVSDIRSVNWYYSSVDNSYYLFLPCTYDKSALKAWFTADDAVYCGGEELVNGEATEIFASGECTLTCGEASYHVVLLDGGDVGTVQITTESGSLDKVHANKQYKDPGNIVVTDYDGTVLYDGALDYIKGRGNSTWNGSKKPYNIKLAKKADLFGMGKSKKWCLLANAGDRTMMRNLIAYKFAKTIGVDTTSDVIPVNLYCNGSYMGAYAVTEKTEIGENRIEIRNLEKDTEDVNEADLDTYPLAGDQNSEEPNSYQYVDIPNSPEDLSGGYLLELEKIYRCPPEASGFVTSRRQGIVIKEPEYSSKAEVEWIRAYYQEFEDALYSTTGYNAQGKYYTEYLDCESVARMYIAEEFGANFDGCSSSFFLYKDVGGKITAGPAWDFDLSFLQSHGINYLINHTCPLDEVDSLYIQHCYIDNENASYRSFLGQLFTHNDFQQVVQDVWNQVVKEIYPAFYASIEPTSETLYSTAVMNAIRWNTYGTTNPATIINKYKANVKIITDYIPQRYEFLSEAYSDDTYFVKYDIGEYGKELIMDTTVYHEGDTAVVMDLPPADNDHCPEGWYLSGDYSGEMLLPGAEITMTDNTCLYAKWNDHIWEQSKINPDWQHCTLCDRYAKDGELLFGWVNLYHFANGKLIPGEWISDENGRQYLIGYEDTIVKNRWFYIDGKYYFFGNDGYAYTGIRYIMTSASDTPTWYEFGEDGGLESISKITQDGLYTYNGDLYYVVDGVTQLGAQKIGDDYYFFNAGSGISRVGHAARSTTVSVKDSTGNGILSSGTYYFGADGKLVTTPMILDDKVFIDGKQLPTYYGLVKIGDDYYYIADNAKIVKGKTRQITTTNDLTLPSGEPIKKGSTFEFDADGKMVIYNGIVGDYYYIQGTRVGAYYGLVKDGGNYYYIGANAKIVRSASQYMTTTNDLTLPDGSPIPKKYFDFDENGVMQYSKELIGDYYYINGVKVGSYYGLIKYEGNYYYIGSYAKIVRNKSQYLTTTNGLKFDDGTAVPHAYYDFDEDGKMKLFTGLNGEYYYINGVKVGSYYGLVKWEGNFYYIADNAKIVKNKNKYLTTTNGLAFADGTPIPHANYDFGEDGKMILPDGIQGDYYYSNGIKVGSYYGLVKWEGNFYYIADYAKIVKNKNKYLTTTNGLTFDDGTPIPHANYEFDAEGKMILPSGIIGDYYYVDGVKVGSYYGLVKWEGNFYYIADNAKIVKNKNKYLTTTNDLCFEDGTPIPHKYYQFDAEGKMIY